MIWSDKKSYIYKNKLTRTTGSGKFAILAT
jgi:hypothetical protein